MTPRTSAIRVPFDVGTATKMTQEELRTELAVHLCQPQKLSLGKAKELAGLTVWQFLQLLGSRGILVNYRYRAVRGRRCHTQQPGTPVRVISDSSPLIALSPIGQPDLLRELYGGVTVPQGVIQ